MPTDKAAFPYLPITNHYISAKDKISLLQQDHSTFNIPEEVAEVMPLSLLQAHLLSPNSDPFVGMEYLAPSVKKRLFIDYRNAKEIAHEFTQNRLDVVMDLLDAAPYVFLTGLSGVGKTTFVQEDLQEALKKQSPSGVLYQGEEQLKVWAEDKSPGPKFLFIDESNLSKKMQLSLFEGLYNNPPSILINGDNYPLTKEHKIIFAGNPISYSEERQLAPFFRRHGNARVFDPLPLEHIYYNTLRPMFEGTTLIDYAETISDIFFEVYHFLNNCSQSDVLITARELEMMALLTASFAKDCSDATKDEVLKIARHYAYTLGKPLVPQSHEKLFEDSFPEKNISIHSEKEKKEIKTDFIITPSRKATCELLDDLLSLRTLRRNHFVNTKQQYGGLGGMILEGDPATGKSDLIIARLTAQGYKEDDSNPEKKFYRIPVSMDLKDKEALLLKAFDEGAVVVIDEINSSPMMERLLNALLMGKTPKGLRPTKPGFMLIGTQNPCTMAGRVKTSTPLLRRLINVTIPPYPVDELLTILLSKKVPLKNAEDMIAAFKEQVDYAKSNNKSPEPTLRDLFRIIKQDILEEKFKQDSLEFMNSFSIFTEKLEHLNNMANESERTQNRNIHFIPVFAQVKKQLEIWKKEQHIKNKDNDYIQTKIDEFYYKTIANMDQIYNTYSKAAEPRGILFKPPASWGLVLDKCAEHRLKVG